MLSRDNTHCYITSYCKSMKPSLIQKKKCNTQCTLKNRFPKESGDRFQACAPRTLNYIYFATDGFCWPYSKPFFVLVVQDSFRSNSVCSVPFGNSSTHNEWPAGSKERSCLRAVNGFQYLHAATSYWNKRYDIVGAFGVGKSRWKLKNGI